MDKNTPIKAIADMLEEDEAFVEEVYGFLKAHPAWEDEEILSYILKKQEGAAAKKQEGAAAQKAGKGSR